MPAATSSLTIATLLMSGAVGVAAGIGGYTFLYAKGAAYLSNDPATCANCHVMQGHLDAWEKGSHHAVATCNDCHTPHALIPKYLAKGLNGWHHSVAFTSGNFPDPIQITPRNRAVTEAQCRRCHGELASAIEGPHAGGEELSCIRCHASVGHLR